MSLYDLKPGFQRLLSPLCDLLIGARLTPNHVTLSAILVSGLSGFLIWRGSDRPGLLWLLPPALILRMALNALDGMVAKKTGQATGLGEVLNEFGDVVSDLLVYLPLTRLTKGPAFVFLFALLAVLSEFAGVLTKAVSGERRYDGPMGKSDRALVVGVYGLMLAPGWPVARYADWIFGVSDFLLVITIGRRLKNGLRGGSP